jgi:hypothetical protein
VVHDIPKLIQYRGGNVKFIQSLDDHFNGGHNDHSNEVRFSDSCADYLITSSNCAALMFDIDHIIIAVASYSLPVFPCRSRLQISREGEGDSTRELQ